VKKEVSSRVVIAVIVIVVIVVIAIAWAVFARKPQEAAPVKEDASSPMAGTPMGLRKGMAGQNFGQKAGEKMPEMPQGQPSPQ
jgi:hypothetical protein